MNSGGSYIKDNNGNETLLEKTQSHKDGDRGRDAHGNELRKAKKMQATAPTDAKTATAKQAKKGDK
jgi:hypothetical protein